MPPEARRKGWVRWTLRLPSPLHKALVDAAWENRRSVNAQMVLILERWLEERKAEDGE